MTTSMKASILGTDGAVTVEDIPVPQLQSDEVMVQVVAVGVCGSDVHYFQHGKLGPYVVEKPIILGHELSGIITAVGEEVSVDRIGQRVAVEPQRPCRTCFQCVAGRYNLCPEIEFFATPPIDGAFCEFVTIQSEFAFEIPDNVTFEAAAMVEPLSVGIWACQKAQVEHGSRILISGAGPIGLVIAQTARALGASEIIITDVSEERRLFALEHGATRAINPLEETLEGLEVDAYLDASGAASAIQSGIKAVRPAGVVVLVGGGNDEVTLPVSFIQNREIWLTGVFRYANTWPTAIEMVASGAVNLDVLVTGKYGLSQVEEALNAGKIAGQIKALVYPGKP